MCLSVPGKIISIDDGGEFARIAQVDFGGIVKEVNISFTPEAKIDDYILVHVGVALSIVNEDEANKIFEYLEQVSNEIS